MHDDFAAHLIHICVSQPRTVIDSTVCSRGKEAKPEVGAAVKKSGFDKERCFLIRILRMVYHNAHIIYTPLYTQNKFCLLFMLVLVIPPP